MIVGPEIAFAKGVSTLRMDFIKAAMQALAQGYDFNGPQTDWLHKTIAAKAVELADATLAKARETQP